jgi:CheY-like chemotaxis protein
VESAPGNGSTFHVYFPRIVVAEWAETEARKNGPAPGGGRILFVDDEPGLTALTKEMLDGLGFDVTAHDDPASALERFRGDPDRFDLVITDMAMPGMNGLDLAREIMAIRPEIGVILCTGYSEQITADKVHALGIRKLMMKPIDFRELSDAIRQILEPGEPLP